jgi:hypothetical protein
VARRFGFDPVEQWHASQLVLVATPAEFDPASAERLPAHVMYTGAVWQGSRQPAAPDRRRTSRLLASAPHETLLRSDALMARRPLPALCRDCSGSEGKNIISDVEWHIACLGPSRASSR